MSGWVLITRGDESVQCPWCGYQHGDAWEWSANDEPKETTCDGCGKAFKHWAEYDVTYCASRISASPPPYPDSAKPADHK